MAQTGTAGTGCPTTGALGSCAFSTNDSTTAQFFYPDGGETAADAMGACAGQGGTWTPGG